MSKTTSATTGGNPSGPLPAALDLRRLFERIDLPQAGRRFLDTRRRDIEALIEANRQAYHALEALGQRQQEILAAALATWQEGVREVIETPGLGDKAGASAKRSQQALGQAVKDLRELAELALKSNQAVLGVLNQRAREHLQEVGAGLPTPVKGRKPRAETVADGSPKAVRPSQRRAKPPRTRRAAA